MTIEHNIPALYDEAVALYAALGVSFNVLKRGAVHVSVVGEMTPQRQAMIDRIRTIEDANGDDIRAYYKAMTL